nr:unnamed protein product [Callosobruchus analis]
MTIFAMVVYHNILYIRENSNSFQSASEQHDYETRGKHKFIPPRNRINKSKLNGIDSYNFLLSTITNLVVSAFKRKIKILLTDNVPYSLEDVRFCLKKL